MCVCVCVCVSGCITHGDKVIAPSGEDMSTLSPCQRKEEAGICIVLHVAADAAQCGHRRLMVRTSGTGVGVLSSIFHSIPAEETWVSLAHGKHHSSA